MAFMVEIAASSAAVLLAMTAWPILVFGYYLCELSALCGYFLTEYLKQGGMNHADASCYNFQNYFSLCIRDEPVLFLRPHCSHGNYQPGFQKQSDHAGHAHL